MQKDVKWCCKKAVKYFCVVVLIVGGIMAIVGTGKIGGGGGGTSSGSGQGSGK